MSFLQGLIRGYDDASRWQKEAREDEIYNLIKPYLQQAQDAQKTSVQSNPNYRLSDFITKNTQDPNNYLSMGDFGPKQESPISLKQAMPMNDWMSKYGWLVAKQIGADALPWAVRTGDENRMAAAIKGGLAMNADQADTSRRKWFETNRDTGLKLQDSGRKLQETGVQYGTNSSLTDNENALAGQFGFPNLKFEYTQTGGYKPAVAQSQIDRNNKQGEAAIIRANRPPATRGGGGGGSGNGKLSQAERWAQSYELGQYHNDSAIIDQYNQADEDGKAKLQKSAEAAMSRMNQYWKLSSGGEYNSNAQPSATAPQPSTNITPQSLQQDQGAAWYDQTFREIKSQHPDASDGEIYQFMTELIKSQGG